MASFSRQYQHEKNLSKPFFSSGTIIHLISFSESSGGDTAGATIFVREAFVVLNTHSWKPLQHGKMSVTAIRKITQLKINFHLTTYQVKW